MNIIFFVLNPALCRSRLKVRKGIALEGEGVLYPGVPLETMTFNKPSMNTEEGSQTK